MGFSKENIERITPSMMSSEEDISKYELNTDVRILHGKDAIRASGLTDEVASILGNLSVTFPISIRMSPLTPEKRTEQDILPTTGLGLRKRSSSREKPLIKREPRDARTGEEWYPKPVAAHQKTSKNPPVNGHLSEQEALSRSGFDLTDHSFGKLPEGCRKLTKEGTSIKKKTGIRKAFKKLTSKSSHKIGQDDAGFDFDRHSEVIPGSTIIEGTISEIDGRICYQTEMPRFEKIKNPKKYFDELGEPAEIIEYGTKEYTDKAPHKFTEQDCIFYRGSYYKVPEKNPIAKKTYIQETEY